VKREVLLPFGHLSETISLPTPMTAFMSVGPKAAGFAAFVRVFTIALPAAKYSFCCSPVLTTFVYFPRYGIVVILYRFMESCNS
jgi:hypothetical protein